MTAAVEVRRLSRPEAEAAFDDLARLRIEVFRDFPYLYEGDFDYERRYLATFMASPGAVVIGALDGGALVGAATAAPLSDHFDEFAGPFAARGLDPADFFYFGESVLRKAYRGRGVGVRFFEEREQAAREAGFSRCVFSSVVRPADHPARPAGYAPLDAFWTRRGYARIEGLATGFSWRDVGEAHETVKPMEFWQRTL
ncbi:MAG: GNAT family N-acetyltransferase [Aquamicrobium sp.]|uniref:GNAT family N-acetyltransferase n=1 Tax=Aquamicrobium sp. TaxID=1872579 RepID=UPI00349E4C5A|nr:GNAT family N-acetyltransferase [Aquamicrobium sp.]